jgi:pantoate--beta-alanine ligase
MSSLPRVVSTRAEMHRARGGAGRTALVPTMGALHHGHRRLMTEARAREDVDTVVVSIFVNPLQFGPNEDYDRYPRTLEADLAACAEEGVDLVFAPTAEEMYPEGRPMVTVDSGEMGALLEGEHRPGFFDGVLTVVAKLFAAVGPDVAVFGAKDAQQLAMVRRMAQDLSFPVHIVGVPTVRDADGLATSSRNAYLSPAERATALSLSRALHAGAGARRMGPRAILDSARARLAEGEAADPPLSVDYLVLVDPQTFRAVAEDFTGTAILAVAARVGATRLIDNMAIQV